MNKLNTIPKLSIDIANTVKMNFYVIILTNLICSIFQFNNLKPTCFYI